MILSLIVATLNRTSELSVLLESIKNQKAESFGLEEIEVILIDQNDDERLAPVIKAHEKNLLIRHIKVKVRGLSNARNIGLKEAKGKYVAFPDDDCFYENDVLERVISTFRRAQQNFGIFCMGMDPNSREPIFRYPSRPLTISKAADHRVFLGIAWTQFFVTEKALAVGGFDVNLGLGGKWESGEETDFAIRFLKSGGKIRFCPEIIVYHPLVVPETMALEKIKRYASGFGALCRKQELRRHFVWKVFKQAVGFILCVLKGDRKRAMIFWNIAIARVSGYLQFKP
ncbi:MAG: glycosyltransferase family 2 protein [bacterium]